MRHTQLLPRHLILILNSIAVRSHDRTGGYRNFDAEQIVIGIREAERDIAENVLSPWRTHNNELLKCVERNFPDLPPIFALGEFQKVVRRFAKQLELDPHQILSTLFQIGILGRVTGAVPKERDEQYAYAEFYFTTEDHGAFPTESSYCLHPIFSRYFGCTRQEKDDPRVVYPAITEGITLSDMI